MNNLPTMEPGKPPGPIIRSYFTLISTSPLVVETLNAPPDVDCGSFTSPLTACTSKALPLHRIPFTSPLTLVM